MHYFTREKRPYGFVFNGPHRNHQELAKTIAHELGHGLFRLEHTFEAYPALSKGSTANLMDYGKGTRLQKYQWDLVHNPQAMLGWFQQEEESAFYGDPYAYLWKEINALASGISYSLYQFNEWVEDSKRSILSLFDFSDVELTSSEEKVYEILMALKEGKLASLSGYTAEEIITGQDLQLEDESYQKLIIYFLQAPTAIDTAYGTQDKTEEGYSLLIFSEEGKADQEVLRVQVASQQKEALEAYLFGEKEKEGAEETEEVTEKKDEDELTGNAIYHFFVRDDDAWYREKQAPYKAITPVPSTNVLTKGWQVAVLDTLKDGKNKEVAKIKLKSNDSIEYTTLSNLSEVKAMSKELKYKMTKEYTAVKLPYSSESTDKTYKKDTEFTAYKRCGDYVKVKGEGGSIEGHWIEKSAAIATEPEFEIKTEDLQKVFTSADKETLKSVVETLNDYSNLFGLTNEDRMANFLAQTGYESNSFKGRSGESGCYTSSNAGGWKIWFNLTWKEKPFAASYDQSLNTVKRYSKKLKWTALACDSTDTKCIKVPDDYVCTKKGSEHDKKFFSYVYQAEGGNGDSKSEDGYKYRGHGAIQLTWKKTYEAFQKWLDNNYQEDKVPDVVEDPTILDTNKEIFLLSALWYWQENGLNKLVDDNSFDELTQVVNSAKEGKLERKEILDKLKKAL